MMSMIFLMGVILTANYDVTGYILTFRPGDGCPSDLCSHDNTCCDTGSGFYACCPVPHATCCEDGATCCPGGYVCNNTRPSTCIQPDHVSVITRVHLVQKGTNQKRHDRNFQTMKEFLQHLPTNQNVDRPDTTKTPANQKTEMSFQNAGSANVTRKNVKICGSSICVENYPCCDWPQQAQCCPYSNGVCCDDYYCCPPHYLCDNVDKLRYCTPFHVTGDNADESTEPAGVEDSAIHGQSMVDIFGDVVKGKNKAGHLVLVIDRLVKWIQYKLQRGLA